MVTFEGLSDASVVSGLRIGQQLFRKVKLVMITISQLRSLSVKETLETDWTFMVYFQSPYTLFPVGKNPLLSVKNANFWFVDYRGFEVDSGDIVLADFFTKVEGRRRRKLILTWYVKESNENIDFSNTVLALGGSKFRGEVDVRFYTSPGAIWPNITIQNQTFDNGLRIIVNLNGSMRKVIFKNDNQLLH